MESVERRTEQLNTTETRVPQVLVGSLVPFGIATLAVLARLYTRAALTRNLSSDDFWISLSWILGLALVSLHCLLTRYGTGHHQSTMTADDFEHAYILAFITKIIYQIILGTTKIAICYLFLCIFQDKKGKRIVFGIVAFITLYTTALLLTGVFQCSPVQRAWKLNTKGICISYLGPLIASGVCNITVNALLIILIIPRVLNLHIQRHQKIALLAVVFLGFLAIVASIVRILQVTKFSSSSDASWDGSYATTWSALEVSAGLLCATFPTLRPLFRHIRKAFTFAFPHPRSTNVQSTQIHESVVQSVGFFWNHKLIMPSRTLGTAEDSTIELVTSPSQSHSLRKSADDATTPVDNSKAV